LYRETKTLPVSDFQELMFFENLIKKKGGLQ
jgi:hypothetical protein